MERSGIIEIIKNLENPQSVSDSYEYYLKYLDLIAEREFENYTPLIEECKRKHLN